MRAINPNYDGTSYVFPVKPGTLSNDFFINLTDMDVGWKPASDAGTF